MTPLMTRGLGPSSYRLESLGYTYTLYSKILAPRPIAAHATRNCHL